MSLVLPGATSGAVTIDVPAVAGTNAITLPAKTGNVAVDGPAFSAYQSTVQSISNNTFTKVQFQTEEFDTASCYDNATNYRFTPNVAGYYQVSANVTLGGASGVQYTTVYKNGARYRESSTIQNGGAINCTVSELMYLNGSTDYIEVFCYQSSGSSQGTLNYGNTFGPYFQAIMVRGA